MEVITVVIMETLITEDTIHHIMEDTLLTTEVTRRIMVDTRHITDIAHLIMVITLLITEYHITSIMTPMVKEIRTTPVDHILIEEALLALADLLHLEYLDIQLAVKEAVALL